MQGSNEPVMRELEDLVCSMASSALSQKIESIVMQLTLEVPTSMSSKGSRPWPSGRPRKPTSRFAQKDSFSRECGRAPAVEMLDEARYCT